MYVILYNMIESKGLAYGSDLQVLRLSRGDTDQFILESESGLETYEYPPQNVIAIVTDFPADSQSHAILHKWAASNGLVVPIIEHNEGLAFALNFFSHQIMASARLNSDLLLRLADMRRIHEELQNSFDGLRTIVSERGDVIPRLAFANMQDPEGQVIQASAVGITQLLPLNLPSLCAVSLFVASETPAFAEGQMIIEVYSPDDDSVSMKWSAPVNQFHQGWITIIFDRPGQYLRRGAGVRLLYQHIIGDGPKFGLGREQLRRDRSAIVDGVTIGRSLAMKLWSSPAGAPITVTSQMGRALRIDRRPVARIELLIDEHLSLSDPYLLKERVSFEPIKLIADGGRIMVHPTGLGPTVAQLHGVVPIGTCEIRADVKTLSDDAERVEYAIAIILPSTPLPAVENLDEFADSIDWLELPPSVGGILTLKLEAPISVIADLLLMTRVSKTGKPDFCWANFTRICMVGGFG